MFLSTTVDVILEGAYSTERGWRERERTMSAWEKEGKMNHPRDVVMQHWRREKREREKERGWRERERENDERMRERGKDIYSAMKMREKK